MRFDEKARLTIGIVVVLATILNTLVPIKVSLEVYCSLLGLFGGTFYLSYYYAKKITNVAVKQYGMEVETDPRTRRMYETGDFWREKYALTVIGFLFAYCVALGLLGLSYLTSLVAWFAFSLTYLWDCVHDWVELRKASVKGERNEH